mgnify:CR=1 FL=1
MVKKSKFWSKNGHLAHFYGHFNLSYSVVIMKIKKIMKFQNSKFQKIFWTSWNLELKVFWQSWTMTPFCINMDTLFLHFSRLYNKIIQKIIDFPVTKILKKKLFQWISEIFFGIFWKFSKKKWDFLEWKFSCPLNNI